MKICSKCNKNLDLDQFSKDSQKSCGLRPSCKICEKENKRISYLKNKEKVAEKGKEYRLKNKELIAQRRKDDIVNRRIRLANWIARNPEKHKEHVRRQIARTKACPIRKLNKNIRTRIIMAMKGKNKSAPTLKLMGCSFIELRSYIESKFLPGMNWENHGRWKRGEPMKWHIDHIIPCDAFDLTKPEEQEKCFHYTNLQPLWAIDNCIKNNKI
jgi:hypothetical protein